MVRQDKVRKSPKLQELEDVFERRTRRFSPFEVLGLKPERANEDSGEVSLPTITSFKELEKTSIEGTRETTAPRDSSDPGMGSSDPPTRGVGLPGPGMGIPSRVVEVYNTTTKHHEPTPGPGLPGPGVDVLDPPMGVPDPLGNKQKKSSLQNSSLAVPVADLVVAAQIGGQIGIKARQVLVYLNSIRSLEHESFTVPVGYGQISQAASIDQDYLRRKVIPKLAMLGLIGVARRSLDGTVYHLPHPRAYLLAVTGHYVSPENSIIASPETKAESEPHDWPIWIDRQQWGWLSQEAIQRLIQKAGSETQAREKLDILIYNETHGNPQQRVRNRRSVLAHYLSSPQAEIWPNDQEFETLSMRQARLERERAQKEKELAEETLKARLAAEKARFSASLSEMQLRWIVQEAKRLVDRRPDAKFLSSRYPLYKAEEERLLEEWLERTKYGESVPNAQEL